MLNITRHFESYHLKQKVQIDLKGLNGYCSLSRLRQLLRQPNLNCSAGKIQNFALNMLLQPLLSNLSRKFLLRALTSAVTGYGLTDSSLCKSCMEANHILAHCLIVVRYKVEYLGVPRTEFRYLHRKNTKILK